MRIGLFLLCLGGFAVSVQAQYEPSNVALTRQKATSTLTRQGFGVKQVKNTHRYGTEVLEVQAVRQGQHYDIILTYPSLKVIEQKIKR